MNGRKEKMIKHPKVLLVDDESSLRRQLLIGLTQRGFEVEECEDGLSALKRIETARRNGLLHHFIVTDIRLPDIDGIKLLQVIKSKYPDLPVVVISGYGDELTRENVEDHLGNAYLDKPFEVDDLAAEFKRIGLHGEELVEPRAKLATETQPISAYVFIRGKSDADLYEIFTKLYYADGVVFCDAVRGDWDIVLLLQSSDRKGIEELVKSQIQSLKGIDEVEIHYSERPWLGEDMESFIINYERMHDMEKTGEQAMDKRNRRQVSAYAMLEIDRSQLVPLYSKLYFIDNVTYCDATDDGNTIILFLQGQEFDQIRRAISDNIRVQPGVLRVKVLNIVEMIAM